MTSRTIAVLHTDESVTSLLVNLLDDEGYRPVAYSDPVSAVDDIRRSMPDLFIVEIGMGPASPSWSMIDDLRANPGTAQIPIVALTTSLDLDLVRPVSCLQNCEVVKEPFDINNLLGVIRSLLENPHYSRCG